jgi:flavin-dependent dehydrogenase
VTPYDVAVIGAGPAGLAAACRLAAGGARVAIIGEEPAHTRQNSLGETLSATVVDVLEELQLTREFFELPLSCLDGFQSTWGSSAREFRAASSMPHGAGWLFDRSAFERMLAEKARHAGATIVRARIRRIQREPHGWSIVSDSAVVPSLHSRFVIYATGRTWTPPIASRRRVLDALIACCAVIHLQPQDSDASIRIDAVEQGWLYSVRLDRTQRMVAFFTDADLIGIRQSHLAIARALRDAPVVAEVVPVHRLANPVRTMTVSAATVFRSTASGEGWLACGDAAQTVDPLSSLGIAQALSDGIEAAQAILSTLHGDGDAFRRREQMRRRRFLEYLRHRLSYYSSERRWADRPFWVRRQDPEALPAFVDSCRKLTSVQSELCRPS